MKKTLFYTLFLLTVFITGAAAQDPKAMKYFSNSQEYYNDKKFDKAIAEINKALEIEPNNASSLMHRGNVYFAMKEYEKALIDYNWTIVYNNKSSAGYFNRANTYYALKNFDSAFADINQSIQLNSNYAPAFNVRGNIYSQFREYAKAIEDYTTSLKISPNSMSTYYNRALSYKFAGLYKNACDDLNTAISMDKKREYSNYVLSMIEPLAHQEKFQEVASLMKAFRKDYLAGFIDAKNMGHFKKYVQAITDHVAASDFSGALRVLREAEIEYSNNITADAANQFDELVYSSILTLKGYVHEKLNDDQQAKQAYEQSLIINNYQPEVKGSLQKMQAKAALVMQQDQADPIIKILEPLQNTRAIGVDDDVNPNTSQRIRGQAIDPSGIKSIRLNNKLIKTEENGYFDTVVTLNAGMNVFTIVAVDKAANSASETIQINTTKERVMGATQAPKQSVLNYDPVYHAILIAETDYDDRNLASLKGPAKDMRKIFKVLNEQYNFETTNTDTLVNAGKTTILEAIINKANSLGENDNLVIFYAGHGELIKQPDNSEEGFLVPVDAKKGKLSSYISSDDLMRTIKYSKSRHILFVADACFAGSLFRDMQKDAPTPVVDAYKDKSRKLLSSGNRTAVPDDSDFIEFFRIALQENREKYITAEQLIDTFKNEYRTKTGLSFQYFPIKNVEDFGGQFVFKRK